MKPFLILLPLIIKKKLVFVKILWNPVQIFPKNQKFTSQLLITGLILIYLIYKNV